jgi:hypothetical protein
MDPPHWLQTHCKRLVWFILLCETNPKPQRRHAMIEDGKTQLEADASERTIKLANPIWQIRSRIQTSCSMKGTLRECGFVLPAGLQPAHPAAGQEYARQRG